MSDAIEVYIGRTNRVPVSFGVNYSGDTITSEIRTETGDLICTWTVTEESDGTDGEYIFSLDNAVTAPILHLRGVMDIKRVSGGEPYQVNKDPIEVEFIRTVTA